MAKGKGGKSDLLGPLYTKPGESLGPHRVEGQKGGMVTPDPMGFGHGEMRHGPNGEQRTQSHDKD
jgi:hypothetical protein